MKKNKTILIFIFSILVAILVVCSLVFFLKVIKNKNQHVSVVFATLEEKIKEKEEAMMFEEKMTEIKSIQNSINSHFVNPNKIDVFVDYLEGIGLDIGSDMSVESIEIPPKTKNIISFKLSIIGTFQEVMRTIVLLENIPYQVNVGRIYLNKEIEPGINEEAKGSNLKKVSGVSTWQADVYFNILSVE